MVVIGFCELVLAESAAEALLSLDIMTPAHIGTANLCNLAAGAGAALLTVAIAEPMAILFRAPPLALLLMALSPLPILSALVSAPTAVLKRDQDFRPFALRSILGLTIGGVCGVIAALTGQGVWSLVIQVLTQRVAEVAILWSAKPGSLRMSWSGRCFHDLKGCAGNVFVSKSLMWGTAQLPRVIIGGMLGPTVLGLFTLANRVADVLLQVVLVPATTVARLEMRQFSENRAGLDLALSRLLREVGLIAFPTCLGLAAVVPPLFSLWLGPRWSGAHLATQITLLTVLPFTYFYCTTAVMMGLKLSRMDVIIQATLGLSSALVTVIAAPSGVDAVCAALLLRLVVMLALPLGMLGRAAGLRPLLVLAAPWRPAAAALVMAALLIALTPWLEAVCGRLMVLPAMILLGAAVYGLLILVLAPGDVRRLMRALKPVDAELGPQG
jgi:O-antigen/teichoic acid export membrane protein